MIKTKAAVLHQSELWLVLCRGKRRYLHTA